MAPDITLETFTSLRFGREAIRAAAQGILNDRTQAIDRPRLRRLILESVRNELRPGKEELQPGQDTEIDHDIVWARSWLLNALTRICDNDEDSGKQLRMHLDSAFETRYWVRYWVLEGLYTTQVSDLEELARKLAAEDPEPLVSKLAQAILASKGDKTAWKAIEKAMDHPIKQQAYDEAEGLRWATLRALRIVPIPAMFSKMYPIVERGHYADATFDAIVALPKAPRDSNHAVRAARTLAGFIAEHRTSPMRDGMRMLAIRGLGELRTEGETPLLIEELTDENPAIVREAARALERILEVRQAAARVLEAAAKAGSSKAEIYGRALRWMNRDAVAEELETAMVSGHVDQQEAARLLLSEIGGAAALQKLQARSRNVSQYTRELEKAEEKIRTLFESSIQEAQAGFKVSTHMDQAVFVLGVLLLLASALMALFSQGNLDAWTGIGTGGAGVLGIVYGVLIAKPREKIVDAVNHLMRLKVVFLGYLRQLHQTDQAYTRRLLEGDDAIEPAEVERFTKMIETTMREASEQLRSLSNRQPTSLTTAIQASEPVQSADQPASVAGKRTS